MNRLVARVRYHAKKAGIEVHVGNDHDAIYVDVHSEDPLDVNAVQRAVSIGLGDEYYVTNPTIQGTVRRLHVGYCGDGNV